VSYDLYVLPVAPGEDPGEALDRLEEAAPAAGAREQIDRIASAIQTKLPHLERSDGDDFVELDTPEGSNPYQILISPNQVGAGVPYWDDDERAAATYRELLGALEIVREQTGWTIYDPQLGRAIGADDLPDILGIHAQGVQAVRSIAEEDARPTGFLRRLFGRGP
jgi:hypothetical protein